MESKILEGQRVGETNRIIGRHSSQINNTNPDFAVESINVNTDGTAKIKYIKEFPEIGINTETGSVYLALINKC
jgi:hypothetical protein